MSSDIMGISGLGWKSFKYSMVGMSALMKEKKKAKEKILPYKDLFTLIFWFMSDVNDCT